MALLAFFLQENTIYYIEFESNFYVCMAIVLMSISVQMTKYNYWNSKYDTIFVCCQIYNASQKLIKVAYSQYFKIVSMATFQQLTPDGCL
jgi:hypothetical protein